MRTQHQKNRLFATLADWFAALEINEVRVAQSVALVAQMPIVIFINGVSILLMVAALSTPTFFVRAAAVGIILAALLPIVFSWRRLRERPLPMTVSRRRIVSIIRHSVMLGILWSALLIYLLQGESDALITLDVIGMGFLCVGGTAALAGIPLASIGFSLPLLAACAYVTVRASLPQSVPILEVLSLLAFGVIWIAVRGWGPMREIISLKSQNALLVTNLQREVKRFRALAELSSDWYWEQDRQFRFIEVFSKERPVFTDLRRSVIGKTRWECASDSKSSMWERHIADLQANRKFTDFEYQIDIGNENLQWFSISGEPQFDHGGLFTGYHGVGKNITKRKNFESEIQRLAYFDPLTELPNRRGAVDRLNEISSSCSRYGHFAALMVIDLDHFKNINDEYGHEAGDELLKLVGQRLRSVLRIEDIAARLGGDEFVVIGSNMGDSEEEAAKRAHSLSDRIRSAFAQPVPLDTKWHAISCSIGLTIFPKPEQAVTGLLREADTAMYRAKASGRNQTMMFDASMQVAIQARLKLAAELAVAEEKNQLALHFQPQLDRNGATVGGEMLLRWTHPVLGNVSPASFIPVAEETGLIIALGDWVLRTACLAAIDFNRAKLTFPISINVSAKQFKQYDFVTRVKKIFAETRANANRMIFEVTESLLIDDVDDTVERMKELTDLGIRFSIDDFGTGYSSLAYLRKLPLYELKIDRSFINEIPHDPSSVAIVSAVLAMAKHLQLRVVAEGVETREQAVFLNEADCDCSQGYLFCRPVPVEIWLEQHRSRDKRVTILA